MRGGSIVGQPGGTVRGVCGGAVPTEHWEGAVRGVRGWKVLQRRRRGGVNVRCGALLSDAGAVAQMFTMLDNTNNGSKTIRGWCYTQCTAHIEPIIKIIFTEKAPMPSREGRIAHTKHIRILCSDAIECIDIWQ